jgi:deoxyribodipyrimidine photo-lyase
VRTTVVLFTRDLRVHDHPALVEACRTSDEVVPLFVLDPRLLGRSPNRDRFLLESLEDLDASLARRGGRLFVRSGEVVAETLAVATEAGCASIHVAADVTPYARARAAALETACRGAGIDLRVVPGVHDVLEPGAIHPADRSAYRVFTPYHRRWAAEARGAVLDPPRRVTTPAGLGPGARPDPAGVRPDAADAPRGGEAAARRRMHAFLGREIAAYGRSRNDLAADATSRLSPYLRFGCVSARETAVRAGGVGDPAEGFLRELAWRDFFRQLLAADPALAHADLRSAGGAAPAAPAGAFEAWCEGRTGVPLVDAGMRQLRREGWIHNRARLVAASFLTRRLGVPWRLGERHFARLLFDGDPASNAGNWQWAAGTGTDPRRTRTLNPVLQARRYDPDGAYVRRYVRELDAVPAPDVLAPWTAPGVLARTGYPAPIVEVPA